jgi:hypothetical protein
MSSILTSKFGTVNALNFEKFVTGSYGNTYITFGRSIPWENGDTIPTAKDTANSFYAYWDDLIGMKKITNADINLVIPRVDWATGTVYVEYGPGVELFSKSSPSNIAYDKKFYVRNTKDQIFKCLFNNNSAASTVMPEITIGGQLPENAYIESSDGYKWKYMYTIPAGLKEKFFTSQFMPIVSESIVTDSAVDGRLDIIKIVTPGAGYNANANSNNLNILSFAGDGSGASMTVKVRTTALNGANIVDYNIINAGSGYTRSTISISDPIKISGTQSAVLIPIIGPPGGHGSNPAFELGATNLMISVGFEGSESGVFPVSAFGTSQFRQIGILKDPKYAANNVYTKKSTHRVTTKYTISQPNADFIVGEYIYVGTSLSNSTFSARVEYYDSAQFHLYVNNIIGSFSGAAGISGDSSSASSTILGEESPSVKLYSGDLLYIENSSVITRDETETQQVKLTLRF